MPWLSIIMALVTFFLSGGQKKENRTRALLAAGLAGAGTYYLSHETDWGQRTLGEFDGVTGVLPDTVEAVKDAGGNPVTVGGAPVRVGTGTGVLDVLRDWGPAGTAAVIGTTGVVGSGNKWLLYGGIALAALFLLR